MLRVTLSFPAHYISLRRPNTRIETRVSRTPRLFSVTSKPNRRHVIERAIRKALTGRIRLPNVHHRTGRKGIGMVTERANDR